MKELREQAGLLQRHVGAEFDIDKAAVSEWERGKSNPDREKLLALDSLYKADGEVLRLYGVARHPDTDIVAAVREAITEGRDRSAKMDEVVAATRDATESLADLTAQVRLALEQVGEIAEFVRRREAALSRRQGELD